MRLTLDLPTDVSIALRRFANGTDVQTVEEAAVLALREYLISSADLELNSSLEEKQANEGRIGQRRAGTTVPSWGAMEWGN